jgi:antitoxin HicB
MSSSPIGSSLQDVFTSFGMWDEVVLLGQKKVIAERLRQEMSRQNVSKTELARRMGTSRSHVEALLDPANTGLTMQSLSRASFALRLEPAVTFRPIHEQERTGRRRTVPHRTR